MNASGRPESYRIGWGGERAAFDRAGLDIAEVGSFVDAVAEEEGGSFTVEWHGSRRAWVIDQYGEVIAEITGRSG